MESTGLVNSDGFFIQEILTAISCIYAVVTQQNAGRTIPEVVIDRPVMTNARARVRRRRIPTRFRGYLCDQAK